MAYATTLKLVSGDTLPTIKITIRDASTAAPGKTLDLDDPTTWEPVDLTGASVVMRVRQIGSETLSDILGGSITDPTTGAATFTFTPNTLVSAGLYEAEVEVTTADGGIFTVYDLVKLDVRDDF